MSHFLLVLLISTIFYSPSEQISHDNTVNPWSYYEEKGSLSMKDWKTKYPKCDGRQQSPINIQTSNTILTSKIIIQLVGSCKQFEIQEDTSHTYTWVPSGSSTCAVKAGGQTYKLVNFHIHTPSEHTINGEHSDLEIHFVHQSKKNNKLAIGILADVNAQNTDHGKINMLSKLVDYISRKKDIDLKDLPDFYKSLFYKNSIIYHYAGSLTTPPCSQGLQWYVHKNPIKLSKDQFGKIKKIMSLVKSSDNGKNNRQIQKLNRRTIFKVKEKTTNNNN